VDVGRARSASVLAAACWPGPLTLLLPRSRRVSDVVTGGRESVGVRVPAHPATTELLERFGGGVAAPSANRFGHVSPTQAEHVLRDLGGSVDVILDGGACPVGVESTIVDCTVEPPQLLRPGGIPREQIAALLDGAIAPGSGPSRASGMMAAHYSPPHGCSSPTPRPTSSGFSPITRTLPCSTPVATSSSTRDISTSGCARRRSRRDDDRRAAPSAVGLGHAIRDRLLKASGGRAG
jgi:L-threonylcarbamoyladenylate synthase